MNRINFLNRLTLIGLILFTVGASAAFSQVAEEQFRRQTFLQKKVVLPTSPEAANLGKYGDVQVGYYTGAMSLSIPLFNLQGKELSLPVALSYDGSGNKVASLPSWVGLGWNLQAGGSITRSVQADADMENNYFSKAAIINQYSNAYKPPFEENDFYYDVTTARIESQPDIFYFNFGGKSGKFYFDANKVVYYKEAADFNLSANFEVDGDISSFVIKDEYGVTYEFYATEETHYTRDDAYSDVPKVNNYQIFNSAWFLTKIISANGNEVIELNYDSDPNNFVAPITPNSYVSMTYSLGTLTTNCTSNPNPVDVCGENSGASTAYGGIDNLVIKNRKNLSTAVLKINNQTVEQLYFVTGANTCNAGYSGKKLNGIIHYGGQNAAFSTVSYGFNYDCSTNRLTLKSIQENEETPPFVNPLKKEPYQFNYNTTTLPVPTSSSIDHFGFYNNNGDFSSLIPSYQDGCNGPTYQGGGAQREPDDTRSLAGLMTRITYPTKGYTDFTYEANKVKGNTQCVGNPDDRLGGGVRLKEVKHYDHTGTLISSKSYAYVKEGFSTSDPKGSSGLLMTEPNYISNSVYHHYPLATWDPCSTEGYDWTCQRLTLFASSNSPLGAYQGSHLGYSRVEETSNGGKVVYHFRNNTLNLGDWDNYGNGDLVKQQVYDNNGKLLTETLNYYAGYGVDTLDNRRSKSFWGIRIESKIIQDNKPKLCLRADGTYSWELSCCPLPPAPPACVQAKTYESKFDRKHYLIEQKWKYLYKTIEKQYFYDPVGNLTAVVPNEIKYLYGNVNVSRPTQVINYNSDGAEYKLLTRYPHDVANGSALIAKGMIAVPLEEENYVAGVSQYRTRLEFSTFGSQLVPYRYYERFAGTEILRETMEAYDGAGNILQAKREFDQPFSLIWSHQDTRLAAKVINAPSTTVAYTAFETTEAAQGNWAVPAPGTNIKFTAGQARTGKGFFEPAASANITRSTNPTGRYIVAYYTSSTSGVNISVSNGYLVSTTNYPPDAAGWTYVERVVQLNAAHTTTTVTVGANVRLDELRFYPENALMQTFSYEQSNRLLNAIANENAVPAEYDYDLFLRPVGIKDENKDYLQTYEYFYKTASSENNVRSRTVLTNGVTTIAAANALTGSSVKRIFQYFDGIGRPVQSCAVEQSPTGKDIVGIKTYDQYGRETLNYLPYTANTNGGALRSSAVSEQQTFYAGIDGGFGYEESILESSPLSRPLQVKPQGAVFRNYPRTSSYGANTASEVRNFRTNTYFPAARLYKTELKDENNNSTISYKDRLGRTVMVNQAGKKTYYVYDDFGNLWVVIPPNASAILESNTSWTVNSSTNQGIIFKYTYNTATQLLSTKKVPGSNAITYYYDRLERPVLTQDANGIKLFTKYDILGRPVITGRYTGTATPNSTNGLYEARNATAPHYYTTTAAFPTDANIQIFTVNYYDSYDVDMNGSLSTTENFNTPPAGYATPTLRVRGKLTASKTAVMPPDGSAPTQYLLARSYNDLKGRTIQSKADNHLGGQDVQFDKLDFDGQVLEARKEHTATPPGGTAKTYIVERKNTYDAAGRTIRVEQKTSPETAFTTLSEYVFSERDLLSQKKLHKTASNTFLQTLDYTYNIRGWMTSINDPANCNMQAGNDNLDLFKMRLYYEAPPTGWTAQYNGNIAAAEWRVYNGTSCMTRHAYRFTYDANNRLSAAAHHTFLLGNWSATNNYSESGINYDNNGNITAYTRRGLTTGTSTFGVIDQLSYYYDDTNNPDRLTRVVDAGSATKGFVFAPPASGNHYLYDAAGNLTEDKHKKFTVAYNHLNLPRLLTFTDGSGRKIEFTYTAGGTKLTQRAMTNSTVNSLKNYAGGIEYNGANTEALYHDDGRLVPNGATAWHYEYSLRDHLGNARVNFRANGTTPQFLDEHHYYPFGMEMEGFAGGGSPYRYNNKEITADFGVNWYFYGARWYDPSIARFFDVDPLASKFVWVTPYNYAENDPVGHVDLWGTQQASPEQPAPQENKAFDLFLGTVTGIFVATVEDVTGLDVPLPEMSPTATKAAESSESTAHAAITATGLTLIGISADAAPGAVAAAPETLGLSLVIDGSMALAGGWLAGNGAKNLVKDSQRQMNGDDGTSVEGEAGAAESTAAPKSTGGNGGGAAAGVDALLEAGNTLDRGGLTAAGRALQKHGSRTGSIFPKATGNVAAINAQGEAVLNGILTNSEVTSVTRHHASLGNILEYRIPGGQGARFSVDGKKFIGFLE